MSNITDQWKSTMAKIFEMLDDQQYKEMVEFFKNNKGPSQTRVTEMFRKELPNRLIKKFGTKGSIFFINKAMQAITINSDVHDLLRPFVEQMRINQENQAEGAETRSHHEQTGLAVAVKPEQKQDGGSGVTQSPQRIRPNMRKSIKDLKASGDLFGKEKYPTIQEGSFYTLREVLMDQKENILKVTEKNMELKAEKLLSPVFTIREVTRFEDKKEVSVKGTVKEIGEPTKIKKLKRDKLDFELEDETGSIRINLWGEKSRQLDGISIGDVVQVQYLKTNHYNGTVSLNSTDLTKINKIESAEVQKVTINIMGISKADKIMTELDVEISNQMKMLEVSSPLLAEVFGLCLDDNFQSKLLEKIECELEAEIQGNKIKNLKAKA
ncbi:uncharacterized protein LOC119781157 [Cyprinodon tularosa]|uniref:uncharacterized protein LOC119781157 n=1 Tax=Cyprinodon tularosa TaxID=77115 RepID=UPI0018E20472|nr:uncharacterized protein LOC119781157 [Cyprinodon tularosa]